MQIKNEDLCEICFFLLAYLRFSLFLHCCFAYYEAADILKKGVVLTLYLRPVESRKFQPYRMVKQWLALMYSHILFFVYTIKRGLSALLILGRRQCESLTGGMSNSSDTRASFFGVFWE